MAQVRLSQVRKMYGATMAVHGVDLVIEDGELVVFLGPSGCGKSTTLRMIAGLEAISSGSIEIGTRDVTKLEPKDRNIAMVFQNYALYPHKTIRENLAFGLRMRKMSAPEINQRVNSAAEMLGLTPLLGRKPGQLSGGQMQRVALGRALVREPEIFLLDEPLSNLDAKLRVKMREEIARLQKKVGTSMVYVTHDQVEAMTLADRIVIMQSGHVQQVGAPLEVYDRPANLFVAGFIGNPPMNFLPAPPTGDGKWTVAGQVLDGPTSRSAPLQFAVRPEDIRPADSGLTATAKVVEPLGAHLLVTCEVEGTMFRAVLDSDLTVHVGDQLTLAPQPDRIRWFDPETTRAVA